jgi:MT0933-like antitoxin protein
MGLRDKLTGLREQAEEAVADHKDQIQNAMETAGAAVDRKTHGKYSDKIAKYGQKANDAVENLGGQASGEHTAEHPHAPAAGDPSVANSGGGSASG